MFYLDIPDTGYMDSFRSEPMARQAYSQTMLPCALYRGDEIIAEKDLVDTGLDQDGNPILILEEQEIEGDEYVFLTDDIEI